MTFERIEQLVRERFNGRHRGCRLHMSSELSKRMMQRYQPPAAEREIERLRNSVFGAPLLYHLMDIPIINDVGITDELQWVLVDATGEEVERGEVDADAPERIVQGADGARTE